MDDKIPPVEPNDKPDAAPTLRSYEESIFRGERMEREAKERLANIAAPTEADRYLRDSVDDEEPPTYDSL